MGRRTKQEIMHGIEHTVARVAANNTIEYTRPTGERVIRLHLTDIVIFNLDRSTTLNSGGWTTVTTKERMNRYLPPGWQLWQKNHEWYLTYGGWHSPDAKTYHYHDGITIKAGECDGDIYDKEREKKAGKWQRKISSYAKTFAKKLRNGEIPAPGAGDCWMCGMVDDKNRAWGESCHDDHVISHVIEKYYVPSLVVRATEQFGVSMCAKQCLAYVWNNPENLDLPDFYAGIGWEQIERAIYRYCIRWAPYNEEVIERIEKETATNLSTGNDDS